MKKWIFCFVVFGGCAPAWAQFPIIEIPAAPAKTQGEEAPVTEADFAKWLGNLQAAKVEAEKAQRAGDLKKRDAAIQDAAKWINEIFMPFKLSAVNRLKAHEVAGQLAHEMVAWGATFEPANIGIVGPRINDTIDRLKGAELARRLAEKADIQSAQGVEYKTFEDFGRILEIPEADPELVKYAIRRSIKIAVGDEKSQLKPYYDRIVKMQLTPAEREEWETKRHLYIIDTEYEGADHDDSLAAIKAIVYDAKAPLAKRSEMGLAYLATFYGAEGMPLVDEMVQATAKDPVLGAKWLYQRGEMYGKDGDFKSAVAAYEAASKFAPANSAPSDEYLMVAVDISLSRLQTTLEQARPSLERLAKSPHLAAPDRLRMTLRLVDLAVLTRDLPKAKSRALEAQKIAGTDVEMLSRANNTLALIQSSLGEVDAAVATWKAIPYAALKRTNKQEYLNEHVTVEQSAKPLLIGALKAQKYDVAQAILDYATKNSMLMFGDLQLFQAEIHTRQGHYHEAIAILKKLADQTKMPQEQQMLANAIANIEKKKAETVKPN